MSNSRFRDGVGMGWWDRMGVCRGKTKLGQRCKRPARKAYEIEKGNLFIPLTCSLHLDQEGKIREAMKKK